MTYHIEEHLHAVLPGGDILFIIPPFASLKSPVMGPHILQAIAENNGYRSDVVYLNILLASIIGTELSESLSVSDMFQYWSMLPERLFARSAYGLPPLGKFPEWSADQAMSISGPNYQHRCLDYEYHELDLERFRNLETLCTAFVEETVHALASLDYQIIGCTTRIGQTNCAVALLNGVKRLRPELITLAGGTNCLGEMAQGIASLSDAIDYVFSGESEESFSEFLRCYALKQLPAERIIAGTPLRDLDTLPLMNYRNYMTQLSALLGQDAPQEIGVWYETSRGCWWGQKRKCTFCGQSEAMLQFRQKSAAKVLHELRLIGQQYPGAVVVMADNIMPSTYKQELLPVLADHDEYPHIHFYYVKANLTLNDLMHLKKARINKLTPGIETFSTDLLKLLQKGVTARDNLQLLRHGRSVGIDLHWFMLWGIPGEKLAAYRQILALLPLIRHFQAPRKFLCIFLERFSCYVDHSFDYQIAHLRPWEVYTMIYPEWADIENLAYYFVGDYPSEAFDQPEIIQQIGREVHIWQQTWHTARLSMFPLANQYIIYDSRGIHGDRATHHVIDEAQAREMMTCCRYTASASQQWAVAEKLGVVIDSWYVPLITAKPEILSEFERSSKLIVD